MAKKTIKAQMKQRRDTKANWEATNPVLLDGELGIVSDDPNLYKVGDGATAWNSLPFRGFDGTLAQELGTSPNAVISQKVVSEKLTELGAKDNFIIKVNEDLTPGTELRIERPLAIQEGDTIWCRFTTDSDELINQGIVNFQIGGANSGTAFLNKDNYFTASTDASKIGIQRSGGGIVGSGKITAHFGLVRPDLFTLNAFNEYATTDYHSTVKTVVGTQYSNRLYVTISEGEQFSVTIKGEPGLLSSNLIGTLYAVYKDGERSGIDSSVSSVEFIKSYTAKKEITAIEIERGASGSIAAGNIELSVYTKQASVNMQTGVKLDHIEQQITKQKSVTNFPITAHSTLSISKDVTYSKGERLYINLLGSNIISDGAFNLYVGSLHITGYIGSPEYITLTENVNLIKIERSSGAITGSGTLTLELAEIPAYIASQNGAMYISPDGNDDNDGSQTTPKASVDACLKAGARKIICAGGTYLQTVNLSLAQEKDVKITAGDANRRVIFKHPNSVLATNAERATGYDKIYKFQVPESFTLATGNRWIYQDGINDVSTDISDTERHPSQRGLTYRCESTKIDKCKSTSLSEALAEIDAAPEYKWFYDSGSRTIYLSAPVAIAEGTKIRIPSGNFLSGNSESLSFEAVGIDVKYMAFNLNKLRTARLTDCSAMYVFGGGAISWDNGIVELIRCEAARCIASESTGDGFNAHADKTGDAHAKTCCAYLLDCWSHDNNDDGYSDHERAECVIRGGLFEYNTKGGITPSYGSHCSCFNVMARQNYNGFYYVGDIAADEGGKAGQLICYNCIAINNKRGGSMFGFGINGVGNSAILIQCISSDNGIAYYAANGTTLNLNDCRFSNCNKAKDGAGTFVINNSEIVA